MHYAVSAGRKHDHLQLALHLTNHELFIQPIGASQHEQTCALDKEDSKF